MNAGAVAPVAIVAGAGGGGRAAAASLAAAGYRVVVVDSRQEAADLAVAALGPDSVARAYGVDLLDLAQVGSLRDRVLAEFGRVDALIHLVGGWRGGKTLSMESVADWNALHPPIVGTLATLTAVFGADVRDSPVGRVVMVTSTAAASPTAGGIAYAAAKAAAQAWTDGVAHFLRDSSGAAVVVAVKALLTDAMIADAPDRDWSSFTHVRDLGDAIARICSEPTVNGARVDLTTRP